ncbi:PQQ-dependent catabolism-associated beta-propeller protein [Ramlibacter monticola]|uniref:PQQ-dependent catabolism-associated beta-propeller protein n=1 Tax=Ramlibacter monticola TaxID=1926872 RepID=A0A936Z993_9BURK|nr:PQQ-dependent catabolism-associated beta-propeller protein [Ramlibacter monticola]
MSASRLDRASIRHPERRGRKGSAEGAKNILERIPLRSLRNLCVLCVRLFGVGVLTTTATFARDTGRIFVSSEKDNAIAIIDSAKGEVIASPVVCKRPRHMQHSPDRSLLYIACSDDHRVLTWDIASGKVMAKLDVGEDPEAFDLSPDGKMLYVSNEEDSVLTAFDLGTRKKAYEVKIGGEPEGVKVSADGKLVYVTSEVANVVHVIDTANRKVLKNVPVGKRPRRFLLTAGGELWVTNELDGTVSVIRTSDHTVQATIKFLPQGMRSEDVTPVGMALSPDGKTAYVGLGRANHVAAVDVATRNVKGYVLVGRRAWGLAVSRDGGKLYVANGLSDDLTIVDTATMKGIKTLKVGRVPYGVVIDD